LRNSALLLASIVLLGCGGRGCSDQVVETIELSDPSVLYEQPAANSPGTLLSLGPHLWEATLDKRGDSAGIHASKVSTSRLVWAELGYYEFQEFGEDELRFEERRVGSDVFRRTSGDTLFQQLPGVPGQTLILQRTLTLWREVVSPFGDQLAYRRQEDTTLDGRAVRVYSLGLAPQVAPESDEVLSLEAAANLAGLAVTPIEVSGLLYVDIETGNRLLAEVEGRYVPRRTMGNLDPEDEVYFTYRESRSPSQLVPTIAAPEPSQRRPLRATQWPLGNRKNSRPVNSSP